jgi:hypothetical protein
MAAPSTTPVSMSPKYGMKQTRMQMVHNQMSRLVVFLDGACGGGLRLNKIKPDYVFKNS